MAATVSCLARTADGTCFHPSADSRAIAGGSPLDLAPSFGGAKTGLPFGKQQPNPLTVLAVEMLLPELRAAIGRADFLCTAAVGFCPSGPVRQLDEDMPPLARDSLQRLDDTFSLLRLTSPQLGLENIRRVYRNMAVALNRSFESATGESTGLFLPNEWVTMEKQAAAYTTRGGAFLGDESVFTALPRTPANRIYLSNSFIGLDKEQKINTTLHELAHYVSGQPTLIVDVVRHGHMLDPGDRPRFDALPPADKLRSADHYAFFASTQSGFLLRPESTRAAVMKARAARH